MPTVAYSLAPRTVISYDDLVNRMLGTGGSTAVPYPDLPDGIVAWLKGLLKLENIPLEWLVPDPAWLPPDSIRMFYVDPEWIEHVVEGVLAAGSIGTQDRKVADSLRKSVKQAVLGDAKKVRAGLLLRSSTVRNYATMAIAGSDAQVWARRKLSEDVLLVLFDGIPTQITFTEPPVGTRFKVEGVTATTAEPEATHVTWDGTSFKFGTKFDVPAADTEHGYLDIKEIDKRFNGGKPEETSPAAFALRLQDLPFTLILGKV